MTIRHFTIMSSLTIALLGAICSRAAAHCDTVDGPVVKAAAAALEEGDMTPVLKWVRAEDEAEVRDAFDRARIVRQQSAEARALADQWFYETVVRLHRASEGMPFDGLKPAGAGTGPYVAAADAALEAGSVDSLVERAGQTLEHGLRERFDRALQARRHADESVEAGREFVKAYVEFVHFAERLDAPAGHAGDTDPRHTTHDAESERALAPR